MLSMSLRAPLVSVEEMWAAVTPFNTPANETSSFFFFCWPCLCLLFVCINRRDWRMWLWCLCGALTSPRMTRLGTYDLSMIRFSQEKKKFPPGLQNFAPSQQMFISIAAGTLHVSGAVTGSVISNSASHFVPLIAFLLANLIHVPKRGHKNQRTAQSTFTASRLRFNKRAHMGVAGIRTSSQPFFDFFWGYTVVWGLGHIGAELWTTSQRANSLCWGAHIQPQSVFGDILWLKTLKLNLQFESSSTLF